MKQIKTMLLSVALFCGCGDEPSPPPKIGACCLRDHTPFSAVGNVDQICRTIYSPPSDATIGQQRCDPDEWFRDPDWADALIPVFGLGYCLEFDGAAVRQRIDFVCIWQEDAVCKKWKDQGRSWCASVAGVWADGKWKPYGE